MELTAFTARLGESQGRTESDSGDSAFVLGDVAGYRHNLEPGDHVEVSQETDLTGIDLIRVKGQLTIPETLPRDLDWQMAILVGGVALARAVGRAGRTRHLHDVAANVSKLAGVHRVALRLELIRR